MTAVQMDQFNASHTSLIYHQIVYSYRTIPPPVIWLCAENYDILNAVHSEVDHRSNVMISLLSINNTIGYII